MRICLPPAGPIELPDATVEFLRRHAQLGFALETGGVLAGFLRRDDVWVVSHPMQPSPRNRAGRFWLKRHRGDAQKFVEDAYYETGGIVNYLGEWHTHPEPTPSPSSDDRQMFRGLLQTSRLEIQFLVGVIVGTTGTPAISEGGQGFHSKLADFKPLQHFRESGHFRFYLPRLRGRVS
jgi:integrative and conjugative element protein (TIGR02256 family)